MANVLGNLIVNLKADTAGFVGDLGKAARAAQNLGKDIDKSFSGLARIASQTFGAFGPEANQAISTISFGLAQVGRAASDSAKQLGKINGAMGLMGAVGGGAAAAFTLVAGGALGMAVHVAEAIDKLNEQAQAAGSDVEAFTALSFVFKQGGVDQASMTSSLERMSRAVTAAGSAAPGARNAFTQLGVSVKNSDGSLRGAIPIFEDLARKFAAMPDGVQKTSLAIEIFGRSGAMLIPVLNQGGDAIDSIIRKARELGIVITEQAAQAADKFVDKLGEIGAAAEGAKIKLTADLLPAMTLVADRLAAGLANSTSQTSMFVKGIALIAEAFIQTGDFVLSVLGQLGLAIQALGSEVVLFITGVGQAASRAAHLDFSGALRAGTDFFNASKGQLSLFVGDSKKLWTDYQTFSQQIYAGLPPAAPKKTAASGAGSGTQDPATIAMQNKLASALQAVEAKYKEQAATVGMLASQVEDYRLKILGATAAQIAHVDSLRKLATASRVAADAFNANLWKEAKERGEQAGIAAEGLAHAIDEVVFAGSRLDTLSQGFENIGTTLEQDVTAKVRNLTDAMKEQIATFGKGPAEIMLMDPALTDDQRISIQSLIEQLDILDAKSRGLTVAGHGPQTRDYSEEIQKLEKLRGILQANGESTLLVDAAIHDANQRLIEQWDDAALKVGSLKDKFTSFANELKLQGADLGAKVFASFSRAIDDLSGELAKFLTTGKASFKELFQSLAQEILKAQIQNGIAKLVGAFSGIGGGGSSRPWDEKPPAGVGAAAGGVLGKIAGVFGVKSTGKASPAGTASDPIYVAMVGGGISSLFAGNSESSGSPFGDFGNVLDKGPEKPDSKTDGILSKIEDALSKVVHKIGDVLSKIASAFSSVFSAVGSALAKGAGAIIGGIGHFFGGFLAEGGDVTPGHAYVVGEKRPELFIPTQAGRIEPSLHMATGGPTRHTVINFHVHGVKDADSFKRSESQIHGRLHNTLAIANARNG